MTTDVESESSNFSHFKKAYEFAYDYFINSEERLKAWLLLIGSILCIIAMIGMITALSWWSVGFWAALTAKDFALLITSCEIFAGILTGLITINALSGYLMEWLTIDWRNWLTNKYIDQYTAGEANYADLMRHSEEVANPEQRIQEDVKSFVENTVSLTLELVRSLLTLVAFVGSLWVTGGSLSFTLLGAAIVIPGYLVWVALAFALVTSVIAYYIGSPLTDLNKQQEEVEADFRSEIQALNMNSESISQDHGEAYFNENLHNSFSSININSQKILGTRTQLNAFQNFSMQLPYILPYLAAAPLYFIGQIEMGQLAQISMSFGEVNRSLGWFMQSYETLAKYKTSIERLTELDRALSGNLKTNPKTIKHVVKNSDVISIKGLDISYPINRKKTQYSDSDEVEFNNKSSTSYMMRGLNIEFKRGQSTLIQGPSGMGKSTLFKVLAGSWKYGKGEVNVPNSRSMFFLPQRPVLPKDTFKAVLAYPDPASTYSDEQYTAVLKAVKKMDQFIPDLNKKDTWATKLSPGQQQRVSFARALLKKPKWLFLDEATASLDQTSEKDLYELLQKELKNTTFISIAHRPAVANYHQRVVTLAQNESDLSISVDEQSSWNPFSWF